MQEGFFIPEIDIAVHARPEALDLHLSVAATGRLVGTCLGFPSLPALFDEQDNDC